MLDSSPGPAFPLNSSAANQGPDLLGLSPPHPPCALSPPVTSLSDAVR